MDSLQDSSNLNYNTIYQKQGDKTGIIESSITNKLLTRIIKYIWMIKFCTGADMGFAVSESEIYADWGKGTISRLLFRATFTWGIYIAENHCFLASGNLLYILHMIDEIFAYFCQEKN